MTFLQGSRFKTSQLEMLKKQQLIKSANDSEKNYDFCLKLRIHCLQNKVFMVNLPSV